MEKSKSSKQPTVEISQEGQKTIYTINNMTKAEIRAKMEIAGFEWNKTLAYFHFPGILGAKVHLKKRSDGLKLEVGVGHSLYQSYKKQFDDIKQIMQGTWQTS